MKGLIICNNSDCSLEPLTYNTPKYMLPLANFPACEYTIRALSEAGIKNIAIISSNDSSKLKSYFGNGSKFECSIKYYNTDKYTETIYSLIYTKAFINDDIIITFADNFFDFPLQNYIETFYKNKYDVMLLLKEIKATWNYDIAEFYDDKLVNIAQNPKITQSKYAVSNIYFFSHSLSKFFSKDRFIKYMDNEIPFLLNYMIHRNYNIGFSIIDNIWIKISRIKDLLECNKNILSKMKCDNIFDPDTRIINSEIKSNVSIGKRSIIKNSTISNSIIMDDCIIDNVILNDSIVGNYCGIIGQNQSLNGVFGDKTNIFFMHDDNMNHNNDNE